MCEKHLTDHIISLRGRFELVYRYQFYLLECLYQVSKVRGHVYYIYMFVRTLEVFLYM